MRAEVEKAAVRESWEKAVLLESLPTDRAATAVARGRAEVEIDRVEVDRSDAARVDWETSRGIWIRTKTRDEQ